MSEEIRFKYLEELERSEALDGAQDTSRERRRKRRSEEGNESPKKKGRAKSDSRGKSREESSGNTVRKTKRGSGAEQTETKRKKKSSDPERSVRNVSVSEKGSGSRRHADADRAETGRRTSGRKKGSANRRRSVDSAGRVTDWDAFLEETARLEAEDSIRQERESRERRSRRSNAAERRAREEKARRAKIIRIVSVLAGVLILFLVVRTIIHTVRSHGSAKPETDTTETTYTGIVTSPHSSGQTDTGETTTANVTVAPTSSVVSIDSSEQLTTLFEDWEYVPSETDVAPEGDIVPTNDTFYSHDMMKRDLYLLRERYPDSVSILRFGYTADGRDLLDVVIGNPDAQKDVIIQYSMHAREYVNSLLGMKQIEELLKGMNNGTQYNGVAYSDILQNVRLHLIPMMNPDGVMIALYGFDAIGNETIRNGLYECWQNDILLGKGDPDILAYYRRWKANARCVDLNRNFDCGWETTVGTTQPSCSRYKGESAASEAETKALVALKDAINCVGQIAYHSEGELVYWDYGSLGDLHVVDEQLADLVSGITGYTKESTVSSNQETAGCSDYFILECSIPSITIETGVGECPIYIDQWDTIWNQNAQVLPAVAQFFAQQGE